MLEQFVRLDRTGWYQNLDCARGIELPDGRARLAGGLSGPVFQGFLNFKTKRSVLPATDLRPTS